MQLNKEAIEVYKNGTNLSKLNAMLTKVKLVHCFFYLQKSQVSATWTASDHLAQLRKDLDRCCKPDTTIHLIP